VRELQKRKMELLNTVTYYFECDLCGKRDSKMLSKNKSYTIYLTQHCSKTVKTSLKCGKNEQTVESYSKTCGF